MRPTTIINKFYRLGTQITLIFILLATSSHAAQPTSVAEYLNNQKVIRVLAEDGGGYGNLSASVNVMIRIRQLGYKGSFEIIYADYNQQQISEIFDLPATIPDDYSDPNSNNRFIKFTTYYQQLKNKQAGEPEGLGVTGSFYATNLCVSAAETINYAAQYNAYLNELKTNPNTPYPSYNEINLSQEDQKMAASLTCRNAANFLNVKTYMAIDNMASSRDLNSANIEVFNQEKYYSVENSKTFLAIAAPDINDAKNYLKNNPRGQLLSTTKPALNTFIDGMENQKYNVLPIYGWTINTEGYQPENAIFNMLQIITAARFAQLNGPAAFRDKALIIAVYYNYDKGNQSLDNIIHNNDWGKLDTTSTDNVNAAIQAVGLRDAGIFSYASLADAGTIEKINNLKPGQILILSMGQLPKVVFDGLYTHTADNIWPQIREGLSSLSSLLLTGRPHFRCSDYIYGWEIDFKLLKDSALKNQLQNFYFSNQGFCKGKYTWNNNSTVYQTLGQFIISAHDPHSSLSKYFSDLKTMVEKEKHDRVYSGIASVIKIQNGDLSNVIVNILDPYIPPTSSTTSNG